MWQSTQPLVLLEPGLLDRFDHLLLLVAELDANLHAGMLQAADVGRDSTL